MDGRTADRTWYSLRQLKHRPSQKSSTGAGSGYVLLQLSRLGERKKIRVHTTTRLGEPSTRSSPPHHHYTHRPPISRVFPSPPPSHLISWAIWPFPTCTGDDNAPDERFASPELFLHATCSVLIPSNQRGPPGHRATWAERRPSFRSTSPLTRALCLALSRVLSRSVSQPSPLAKTSLRIPRLANTVPAWRRTWASTKFPRNIWWVSS